MIPTLEWLPEGVNFLDQTKLPLEETYVLATDYQQVATVIRDMIVRGAPAIGVSAAMGFALGVSQSKATDIASLNGEVATIAKTLAETRPTAVNLFWAIDRMRVKYDALAEEAPPSPRSRPPSSKRPSRCTTKTSPPASPWEPTEQLCSRSKAPF